MQRPLIGFALLAASAAVAFAAFPRMISVEPAAAKPGDHVVVSGQNLEAENVVKLFLTAGGSDHEVAIVEQGADSIRFTIPSSAPLGSYNLMVQTGGEQPSLVEQPVRLEVADEAGLTALADEAKRQQEELEEQAEATPEPAPAPVP